MNNYNCRKCHIRERCITESNYVPHIQNMIRFAFEARTDTLATWARLKTNCLLAAEDDSEDQEAGTALSRRLTQAHRVKKERTRSQSIVIGADEHRTAQKEGFVGREELTFMPKAPKAATDHLEPVSQLGKKHFTTMLRSMPVTNPISGSGGDIDLHWLTIENSWRHITLPIKGALVLGRFDPDVGIPPDVDLSFEDRNSHLLSRRHMSIAGENGKYTIQDLGSQAGVFLNNEKLGYGPSRSLRSGDRIQLGNTRILFDRIPQVVLSAVNDTAVKHTLTITATGHKIPITPAENVLIGHSDPQLGYSPDLDMGNYGAVAQRVSRRHAQIHWRNNQPYIEDLGSAFGTRIRGDVLPLGKATRLIPGDHMWLAGCVVAYDVEVSAYDVPKAQPIMITA